MSELFLAVFETAIGWMGLAWTRTGVAHVQLPGRDRQKTLALLQRRAGGAVERKPQGHAAQAVDLLTRYAAGEAVDFSALPLDLAGVDPFNLAIYQAARRL